MSTPGRTLWLLLAVNVVLQIPWSMHEGLDLYLVLLPVGELLLLAALCARWPGLRGSVLAALAALMLVELDRIAGVYILSHDPLFYDQIFLMRHLFFMLSDLWTPVWTLATAGVLLGLVAGGVLLRWAVWRLSEGLPALPGRLWRVGGGVVVVGTLLGGFLDGRVKPVRWISVEIGANLVESVRIWQGIRAAPETSPYRAFSAVSLNRQPDVRFYVVESYGRLLFDSPLTGEAWGALAADLEAELSGAGWHIASAYSRAPVSGGRSWLADGSIFLGMSIRYESVYRHLLQRVEVLPDMVEFFGDQGYRTVRVAPKDRDRPGLSLTNDFAFQQQVTAVDLGYTGPALGWGVIPDQHSLGFIEEQVLPGGPLFLFFHMVSSHIPWQTPPPILDDWRALAMLDGGQPQEADRALSDEALRQLRRYRRNKTRIVRSGSDALTLTAYTEAVRYDMEILRRHLLADDRDALVVVMGDHQPPLVTRGERRRRMDVPVHVLSRDPSHLTALLQSGFVPGMIPDGEAETALHHSGIFSLLVHNLAQCCGAGADLPEHRPAGIEPTQ